MIIILQEVDVGAGGDASITNGKQEIEEDNEFFDKIKTEAKKTFRAEQAEEQRKAREVRCCSWFH